MSGIRIITDGASDLPVHSDTELAVAVVPLEVRIGSLDPASTAAMTVPEFWQACAESEALPETSAPSPGDFQREFLDARDRGYDGAVCITLSCDLSATYQAATSAAAAVADDFRVEVVDSRSATMGEGLVVLEAAEAACGGADLDTVAARARAAVTHVVAVGALDTLDNLRKGGRIGSAQAFFGSLLAVKPIIVIRDGIVAGESRQRTRRRSLSYVAETVAAQGPFTRLAVIDADAPDVEALVDLVAAFYPREQILRSSIGPVVGTHTGAGTVAICALRA